MKTFARIENEKVVEIIRADVLPMFHPSLTWVEAAAAVEEGWIYANGTISPPPPPSLESLKTAKIEALAAKRWTVETGGISVNGVNVNTDRESYGLILGAIKRAERQPEVIIEFKGANGWVLLTKSEIDFIGDLVGDHVQACFSHERTLSDAITAAPDTAALDTIDITAGWPPN